MTIEKYHFDDLTKINTAIGLLDDDTLTRLHAHEDGYEYFHGGEWNSANSTACISTSWVVRAKPIPVK